ncbi:hypothetical protein [Chelativorans alearense]|uniref:hypothetical protein n=1 Tax=Chelativorans alearense TaxID=2681495 RepID=UPI0013D2813C|nr:hypothetical protein [Chelativorans alearense]
MADFTKMIDEIRAKIASTADRLAELREKRRPHALGAFGGDEKASAAVAKIAAEESAVRDEADTLALALEEAEKRKAEADRIAAEKDQLARDKEAKRISKAIEAAAVEFDVVAMQLVEILEKRAALISELRGTRVLYDGYIGALQRPSRVMSALWAAGLGRYDVLKHVDGAHRHPLAKSDAHRQELFGGAIASSEDAKEVAA